MTHLLIIYGICTIISMGLFIAFCFSPKSQIYRHKVWHVILVVLLFLVFSPVVILAVIYVIIEGYIKKVYYRNRPRPIPEKIRHCLKDGLVVNEKGELVQIEEYNALHNTSYTLKDVYGKSTKPKKSEPECTDLE